MLRMTNVTIDNKTLYKVRIMKNNKRVHVLGRKILVSH